MGFFCLIITEFLLSIFLDTPHSAAAYSPHTHTHTHTAHPPQDDSICLQSSSSLDVLQPHTPRRMLVALTLTASSWVTPPPLLLTRSCTPSACHRLLLHHAIPNSATRERHLPRDAQHYIHSLLPPRRCCTTRSAARARVAPNGGCGSGTVRLFEQRSRDFNAVDSGKCRDSCPLTRGSRDIAVVAYPG